MINKVLWLMVLVGGHFVIIHGCTVPNELLFNFIDASAKIPSAILSGNLIDMGAFDQCLALDQRINDTRYRGRYCMVKVPLPDSILGGMDGTKAQESRIQMLNEEPELANRIAINMNDGTGTLGLLLGWCVPDSCPIENVTHNIVDLIDNIPLLPESFKNITIYPFMGGLCQTQEEIDKEASNFSTADLGTIGFLGAILGIMIFSTIYDVVLRYQNKKPAHILLIAFSVRTNGEKLLVISNNPNQVSCIHGIRCLSMAWIIYSHRFLTFLSKPLINIIDLERWRDRPENMYMLSATVNVDTFFVLSGLLVAYGFLQAKEKGVKFNVFLYWIHRYIRLTPAFGVMILINATIITHLGSGPFWSLLASLKTTCVEKWWHNLLYIQNYYENDTICLGQSWYLAVDTQLFFLSPLILIPLWRWPKHTMYGLIALLIGSIISPFVVSYHYDLPMGAAAKQTNVFYRTKYYYSTHTRFGPWLMGIMLGYYIFILKKHKDPNYTLHPSQVTAGWLLSLTLLLTVLFAPYNAMFVHDRIADAFFTGLHRHAWSLGLCWIIYACTEGYGGPINAFLSWAPFQVLGRLTYTLYLVHMNLQYHMEAELRTLTYFSDFNMVRCDK
ncbi:uncharacterized protein CBL_01440 [Carabus blaptoides fortunei]